MSSYPESLVDLGWDDAWDEQLKQHGPGLEPARVAVEHRGAYTLIASRGEVAAEVTGKLRHAAAERSDLPAVGDWVAIDPAPADGSAPIRAVLPRRSVFSRKVAGFQVEEQIIAANIDVVFVVSALDADLNLRRIERYLTLAWESGATPVVVLTKSDISPDVAGALTEVAAIAAGAEVHAVSALEVRELEGLRPYLDGNRTVALLGSSGVGKSTLINTLLGSEVMVTKEIRWDGKGRHTTTHRQLIPLPGGGALIDTPGMRELQLWDGDAGVDLAFRDIAELAAGCRFSDCSHEHEPGCAVLQAVQGGALAPERLASYRKQVRELAAVARKKDTRLASAEAKKWKRLNREAASRARLR